MSGYYQYDAPDDMGSLCRFDRLEAFKYDPAADSWKRWEYGDAAFWGQGPANDIHPVGIGEVEAVMYRLQVAACLQKLGKGTVTGSDSRSCVRKYLAFVLSEYERHSTPEKTARYIYLKLSEIVTDDQLSCEEESIRYEGEMYSRKPYGGGRVLP